MLVDFAPEMNGNWFPWSGVFAGGEKGGPEAYKAAYRHVVDLFRERGRRQRRLRVPRQRPLRARRAWNDMARYYPGDDYIDWIGLSAYGGVFPGFDWEPLRRALDEAYPKLEALSPTKPIAILETGVIEEQGKDKAAWIRAAYDALASGRYPRVKAAIWWHERWTNEDDRLSDVRIDSDAAATAAYRKAVAGASSSHAPSTPARPRPEMRGGIDLGGTKIQAVVVDDDSKVLGEARVPTPTEGGPADVSEAMAGALRDAARPPGSRPPS